MPFNLFLYYLDYGIKRVTNAKPKPSVCEIFDELLVSDRGRKFSANMIEFPSSFSSIFQHWLYDGEDHMGIGSSRCLILNNGW